MEIVTQNSGQVEIDEKSIIILLNPYSYNPTESFHRVCKIVKWIRENYPNPVFSPILHTHFYDLYCKEHYKNHHEDYYEWDLNIYEHLKSNAIFLFTSDWESSKGCRLEMDWALENKTSALILKE